MRTRSMVAAAAGTASRRAHVSVEFEFLAQANVHGAEAAPDGRGQRTF